MLALLLLAGCSASAPGAPIDTWEQAGPHAGELAPPLHPPAELDYAPADRPIVRSDGSSQVLWLRARVRWDGLRDPVVLVPRAYVAMSAYLDGERVIDGTDYRAASGVPFHLIPLPGGSRGEATVVLRVASRYTQVGLPEGARVGERAELLEALVRRDLPRMALAIAVMAIGIGAALFALRGRQRRALVGIALFSLGIGVWALFQTRTHTLWLPQPSLWFALWWIAPSVTSFGAATFVAEVFGETRVLRGVRWFFLGHAVLALLSLALDEGFYLAAPILYVSGRAVILGGTAVVLARAVSLARAGDPAARRLLWGFGLASVGILHDVLTSLGLLHTGVLLADVGYLGMQLSWITIVVDRVEVIERDVARQAESLARFVRERDELVRDLHDGVGGVVTNVRLLADRAGEADETERRDLVAAIGSLAAEGMHELRLLMLGFDALPSTWRAAAAELRRAGSAALEPHGIEHAFEAEVQDDRAPDLATFITLVRIHREALTNVVKHARARAVRVRVVVRLGELSLTIEDDGLGLADTTPAVGHGRGMGSMQARARAIGATLRIEPTAPGTRVHLERR